MSDLLGCEKWSNVSKKCYVEEAKSYTQPGSVAEKKAFFDAYYKKLAAQKAAAAALLEQEKAAAADAHQVASKVADLSLKNNIVDADINNNIKVSLMKRPLLKSKTVHHRNDNIETPRTKSVTTNGYIEKRSLAPKSLKVLMNSSFVKESSRITQSTKSTSSVNSQTPKRSVTPMKTPAKAFVNGVNNNKQPLATLSVNRRIETTAHTTKVGTKSTGPKWHILSAVSKSFTAYKSKLESPTILSPFVLRTEDRAARRKHARN
ncbi:uncharacterized protein LOC143549519 [Bidens hawaiensis]|uniref:uncharacterized protein LOC143549519 n=1 Tax=Bidens hawaiensis TaxID=980011 RepID=UPI004049729A